MNWHPKTPAEVDYDGEIRAWREKHCWSHVDGTLKVARYDGGGGPYIVINATEWSEDSVDELCDRIRAMWKRLEFAPEGKP